MSQVRPSIGRIVHYFEYMNRVIVPMAALIIDVHDDDSVALKVTDPNGADFIKPNVFMGEPNERGSWNWPARV